MTENLKPALFNWNLRVYYEDTDLAGVVYYANYLKFYERARTEWLRSLGLENSRLKAQDRLVFVVTQCNVSYLAPAMMDDHLLVTVDSFTPRKASAQVVQSIYRNNGIQLLSQATISFASVHCETYKPLRMPSALSNAAPI
jgi:acyl-CoA thioester hydrolase